MLIVKSILVIEQTLFCDERVEVNADYYRAPTENWRRHKDEFTSILEHKKSRDKIYFLPTHYHTHYRNYVYKITFKFWQFLVFCQCCELGEGLIIYALYMYL